MAFEWDTVFGGHDNISGSLIFELSKEVKNDLQWQISPVVSEALKGLGRFFYLIDPSETSFKRTDEVPNYFRESWPYFLLFIIVENIILWAEKNYPDEDHHHNSSKTAQTRVDQNRNINSNAEASNPARINDSIISISHGLLQECGKILFRGAEGAAYVWIYDRLRVVELPWDSPFTWYAAAIGVDFCYYWVHRASHEVHILWAQHQVHHSSEEFNFTVGLRQSVLQGWCGFLFYLPMALFVPPSHFLTHQQFSLLYQFWMHTKVIRSLGPLEYILNTPKHHRVHHGSNLYCLDKNYGGFLIIWDRIFGTFAEEKESEEIVYGLVFNQPSFNPLHLQWFYTSYVITKVQEAVGWRHKLASIFYGPSWIPGAPRLGREEDKIDVKPRSKYDVQLPIWMNIYLVAHFLLVLYGFQELSVQHLTMAPLTVVCWIGYILLSITSIGLLFDGKVYACALESFRCALLAVWLRSRGPQGLEYIFILSCLFWAAQTLRTIKIKTKV